VKSVWRASLAIVTLLALVGAQGWTAWAGSARTDCPVDGLVALGQQLAVNVGATAAFGVPVADAPEVFYAVTRERALPAGYVPPDLVSVTAGGPAPNGAQRLRRIAVPDLDAMFAAARADGVVLGILSGYRSEESQAALFDSSVRTQLARGATDREDAEARTSRFRARPGHSQHQLGTTLDVTSPEIGNGIGAAFGASRAGRWVRARAWEFGFVLPYTEASEPRTGYAPEPWHVRWVGRDLAAWMMEDGYLDRAYPTADDYVAAVEWLLGRTTVCAGPRP
jgi:D-alanyl-D-alanine carboxypeptidase